MSDLTVRNIGDFEGDKGRVLLLGLSGSGKTSLAGSVAELGKTLYAYVVGEEGISSLRGEEWSDNIDVVRITDPTQIRDIFHMLLGDHDYTAFCLDSWSALDALWRRYILGLPQDDIRDPGEVEAVMSPRDWGLLKDITMDVAVSLYGLASHDNENPVHVITTSQVKEYDDETSGEQLVGADVSKGVRSVLHSTPDFILHLEVAEDPDSLEREAIHRVRLMPHERLVTKLHTERERKAKMPVVVGNREQVLTMSKFFKMTGVPL